MILFRNKINLLDLTFSLSDAHLSAIIEDFIFFLLRLHVEIDKKTFKQIND